MCWQVLNYKINYFKTMSKIEFYKHNLDEADKNECRKVLDSLFLTTGDVVKTFEKKFADYLRVPYAVAVTSCTEALFLCLKAIGVGSGDEVITTPLSFIATANVVEHCGAKPVFVEVEKATGNINADLIESAITPRTKAIIVVHLYGQMCDMKKIRAIANRHHLKLIEDAAHCIEGSRDGVRVGELGDFACFSFYAVKNITSGEGGAIVTHSAEWADWLFKARQHGMSKTAADRYSKKYEHYDMEFLGYKCNLTNIAAALLVHQLDRIEDFLSAKERIAKRYNDGFKNNVSIRTPAVLSNTKHARHLYTIWVDPPRRDEVLAKLQAAEIGVAINFRVIHLMKYYREKYGFARGSYPIAEGIGDSTITIPLYPKLTDEEVARVVETVNTICHA